MINYNKSFFILISILCLTPYFSASLCLFIGICFSLVFTNPFNTQKITSNLLKISIIGLGAKMNLKSILETGVDNFFIIFISISLTLIFGILLGKFLKTSKSVSYLITIGTAICGGSAIAAAAPILKSKNKDISIALIVVFSLNALALFIFPIIGNIFNLTQSQFGLWSAIAIHDTSSVVGATIGYGEKALEIGTTVKLTRALWIIPIVIVLSYFITNTKDKTKIKIKKPWFILGFILMAAFVTFFPNLEETANLVSYSAKKLLNLCLFFIGLSISKEIFSKSNLKPFIQGITLWLIVSISSLIFIINF